MSMHVPGPIAPERQSQNWKSSNPDFKVHVPAATAWTRELATERNGCQNSLLSGPVLTNSAVLLKIGTKTASGEPRLRGAQLCWRVL